MKIDSDPTKFVNNKAGDAGILNVMSPLYIGGLPQDVLRQAKFSWHIRNTDSFLGEILTYR